VETIERARHEIGAYIEHYHRRPHSGLAYRTPLEVATTWRGHQNPEKLQTLST
jgi:putative transposase